MANLITGFLTLANTNKNQGEKHIRDEESEEENPNENIQSPNPLDEEAAPQKIKKTRNEQNINQNSSAENETTEAIDIENDEPQAASNKQKDNTPVFNQRTCRRRPKKNKNQSGNEEDDQFESIDVNSYFKDHYFVRRVYDVPSNWGLEKIIHVFSKFGTINRTYSQIKEFKDSSMAIIVYYTHEDWEHSGTYRGECGKVVLRSAFYEAVILLRYLSKLMLSRLTDMS